MPDALTDIPIPATPKRQPAFLCRLGWHECTCWQFDAEMSIARVVVWTDGRSKDAPSKPATRQKRECVHCGKLEYHTARTP